VFSPAIFLQAHPRIPIRIPNVGAKMAGSKSKMSWLLYFLLFALTLHSEFDIASASKKKKSSALKKTTKAESSSGIDKKKIKKMQDSSNKPSQTVVLPSGQALAFHDSKATPKLAQWANELSKTEGSVTYGQAVSREQYVIQQVFRFSIFKNCLTTAPDFYFDNFFFKTASVYVRVFLFLLFISPFCCSHYF
jgi:hypothetical protein